MMLKIVKSKFKIAGVITLSLIMGISYLGLSFYSIPEKVNAAEEFVEWRSLENITYMQEMTVEICNNSKIGENQVLTDTRGGGYENRGKNNSYVVQKLEDGNCWMLQNMNLTNKTIDSTDSNLASGSYPIPAHSTSGWSTSDGNSKKVYYTNTDKYGAYYTWCAATAGTCVSSGEAAGSICPKGWRLPTSGITSTSAAGYNYSFNKLVMDGSSQITPANAWKTDYTNAELGITTATSGAVFSGGFFPAAGNVYSGSLREVGSLGRYWSSTAYSGTDAYYLYFNSSSVNPSNNGSRYVGFSVRCVANPDIHSVAVPSLEEANTNVSVNVGPTLTIDATEGMNGEVDHTKILEGDISATVSSNRTYQMLLSATEPALVSSTNPEAKIIAALNTAPLQKGISGWGIYTGEGNTPATKVYAPITTTPQPYYNTTSAAADGIGTIHTFGVGISVSPSIPNGTYSTIVTVTAANS